MLILVPAVFSGEFSTTDSESLVDGHGHDHGHGHGPEADPAADGHGPEADRRATDGHGPEADRRATDGHGPEAGPSARRVAKVRRPTVAQRMAKVRRLMVHSTRAQQELGELVLLCGIVFGLGPLSQTRTLWPRTGADLTGSDKVFS